MDERERLAWFRKHNLPDDAFDKFDKHVNCWWTQVKTMLDLQIMLTCNIEFYVTFKDEEYFIISEGDYRIYRAFNDEEIFQTDDLDDFGENARIGENCEFYLKDVINELEW